jgi:hypothetical protein
MNLDNFYESTSIKPLIQNAIVESKTGHKYRVDRWFKGDNHCYVFVDIGLTSNKPDFAQSPSQVQKAILTKKIIVTKNGTESFFN